MHRCPSFCLHTAIDTTHTTHFQTEPSTAIHKHQAAQRSSETTTENHHTHLSFLAFEPSHTRNPLTHRCFRQQVFIPKNPTTSLHPVILGKGLVNHCLSNVYQSASFPFNIFCCQSHQTLTCTSQYAPHVPAKHSVLTTPAQLCSLGQQVERSTPSRVFSG